MERHSTNVPDQKWAYGSSKTIKLQAADAYFAESAYKQFVEYPHILPQISDYGRNTSLEARLVTYFISTGMDVWYAKAMAQEVMTRQYPINPWDQNPTPTTFKKIQVPAIKQYEGNNSFTYRFYNADELESSHPGFASNPTANPFTFEPIPDTHHTMGKQPTEDHKPSSLVPLIETKCSVHTHSNCTLENHMAYCMGKYHLTEGQATLAVEHKFAKPHASKEEQDTETSPIQKKDAQDTDSQMELMMGCLGIVDKKVLCWELKYSMDSGRWEDQREFYVSLLD